MSQNLIIERGDIMVSPVGAATISHKYTADLKSLDWPTEQSKDEVNGRCMLVIHCTSGQCFSSHVNYETVRFQNQGEPERGDNAASTESAKFDLSQPDQCVRLKKAFDDLIRIEGGKHQVDAY